MLKERPLSLFILIFVIALFLSYHVYYYCLNKYQDKQVTDYINENSLKDDYKISSDEKYLGVLSIPKLSFQKGFYQIDSLKNDVNQNIQVLSSSEMPNVKGSSLILAAHIGKSYLGYFNNLDKLTINDTIDIYYQDKQYQYEVFNIKEIPKTGYLSFNKNVHENYLILTTCSKMKNHQLVIMAKLIKEEASNINY